MSIRVNLLPWREYRREKKRKEFMTITGIVVLATAAALFFHYSMLNKHIEKQEEAKRVLNAEISKLDAAAKKKKDAEELSAEIRKQIDVISQLQDDRIIMLKTLEFFAQKTPDSVFLSKLEKRGRELSIEGVAENDEAVAETMRRMESFPLFHIPYVQFIEKAKSNNRYSVKENDEVKTFRVSTIIREKNKEEGEK